MSLDPHPAGCLPLHVNTQRDLVNLQSTYRQNWKEGELEDMLGSYMEEGNALARRVSCPMGSADIQKQIHDDWESYSQRQVELLRGLREELATRRWELILEIDVVRDLLRAGQKRCEDQELQSLLTRASDKLNEVKRILARIPDDFIPPF